MNTTMHPVRRSDIDMLRVLATLLLFVFHTGMIFNPAPFYHLRNGDLSVGFLVFCGFISLWHMPLFFLLAGWSLAQSLDRRGPRGVLAERLLRIGVPLLACTTIFGPPIKYIELSGGLDFNHRGLWVRSDLLPSFREVLPSALPTMPAFDRTFLEFLPRFFTDLDSFSWSHLWFLAYLLTFTVVYLPVLSRLTSTVVARLRPHRWLVFAPIVPLAAIQIALRPHWPGIQNLYDDWANFAYYSVFLAIGFVLARHPELEKIVHGETKHATLLFLVAGAVLLVGVAGIVTSPAVILACTAIAGWSFMVAILGVAQRRSRPSAALAYLSDAALPIYILHQPAIVLIGCFVVAWPLGILSKFILIVIGAAATSFALYHWPVRRSTLLRLFTGMPRDSGAAQSARRFVPASVGIAILGVAVCVGAEPNDTPEGLWWAEGGAAQVRIAACDAGSGNSYRCTLRLADPNRIELRGYVGIPLIGRTTNWFRVGSEPARCELTATSG